MTRDELIAHTKRLIEKTNDDTDRGTYVECQEFLRTYGGPGNTFFSSLAKRNAFEKNYPSRYARSVLKSFLDYLEAGLHAEISPERKAQLDVVSDYLEMANIFLETPGVHPAAPAMLIGATLEEFLRTWVETQELSLSGRKPGIETYS